MHNPILPGFHPDPSICRVGSDYYLATSTFEWFPGVALFHSVDLAHWFPIGHGLTRSSQLNLIGVPNSGGVWAPCLSYADGLFWLVFTNSRNWGATMDTPNYLVTASDIHGPWSDPIHLNSSGFDPSLFHDLDGRKWLVNIQWDHRPGNNEFAGILLQEYDSQTRKLVGSVTNILRCSEFGHTEGPHLYRRGDYYYLLTAEGGCEYGHAATIARSRKIDGPYEVHPNKQILTAREDRRWPLQKTGHASVVETPEGEWHMVYLCARPLPGTSYCNLGRETGITPCQWTDDGWLEPVAGLLAPVEFNSEPDSPPRPACIDFGEIETLPPTLQTLRCPPTPDWCSMEARPGWLRLTGRESMRSLHHQSTIGRRLEHFQVRIETCLDFHPKTFQQLAGLAAYYDTDAYYYLHVTWDENLGRCLRLLDGCAHVETCPRPIKISESGVVHLAVEFDFHAIRFSYSLDGKQWQYCGHDLEAAKLSDEWAGKLGFTGTMVVLNAQDLGGTFLPADFKYFRYFPARKSGDPMMTGLPMIQIRESGGGEDGGAKETGMQRITHRDLMNA